ncbi:hypothetical protein CHLNCDRAFT_132980 [Chlorella variabilis]|uniref:Uncharacterized protein n=1 Tax=Chlorella variabilis TaxID=554065 RepID=E1Z230_CHLVA|nr:hypothetical protein CHLNCDRAFT_132980 [Chlorella variabilis]EFN59593.1 hypothetical protein CHLNCDRAFT_132980 [Chlorella variabilis]|eukprot:XP_005851695.1 hypothetical protein CHLNCDRAFT_132980 [Chlorella variabilis]
MPTYEYRGSGGLLDGDDPRGLKKRKTLARRVASHAVKIVVGVLLLVACGGWLWAHKHKRALHEHLDTTLTHLDVAESDKSHLRRLLSEREERLKSKDRELGELRNRLERLTGELGNTHNKHSQHSGKLEQDLLNCQGELLVANNRVKEVEAVAREQEQLAATFQERLEAETRKQVNQESAQVQENGYLRKELQECQAKLQRSAAGNLDPTFLAEQQRLREQEASAKAKLHASATPENLATWRGHLPPGPAPIPLAQQQQQGGGQQQQQQQQQPQQQAQQQDQIPQPVQTQPQLQPKPVQAPGQPGQQQAPQEHKAPQPQQVVQEQAHQAPQAQQQQQQGQQQGQQEIPKPTGKRRKGGMMARLREARQRRARQRARQAAQGGHALSQLEQALGHEAHEDEEEHAQPVPVQEEEEEEAIEQHPERQWP